MLVLTFSVVDGGNPLAYAENRGHPPYLGISRVFAPFSLNWRTRTRKTRETQRLETTESIRIRKIGIYAADLLWNRLNDASLTLLYRPMDLPSVVWHVSGVLVILPRPFSRNFPWRYWKRLCNDVLSLAAEMWCIHFVEMNQFNEYSIQIVGVQVNVYTIHHSIFYWWIDFM